MAPSFLSVTLCLVLAVLASCDDDVERPARLHCVAEEVCKDPYYKPITDDHDEVACEDGKVYCIRQEETKEEPNCGYYTFGIGPKRGGDPVKKGEVTWMTTIRSKNNDFLGSGVLVHAGAIVTTASIVHGLQASDIVVHVDADTFLASDNKFTVSTILRHSYNKNLGTNNIAVLILSMNVILTDKQRALCLPRQSKPYRANVACMFSGWDFTKPEGDRNLLKSQQLTISNNQCQDELRNSSHFPWWLHLHSSFLCTISKFPTEEPSNGNAGSPLFCPISSRSSHYVLAGLASWGDGKGLSVFTNVAQFSSWIDNYLGRLHDDFRFNNYRLSEQIAS